MEQRQERRLTRVLFEGGLDAALGTVTPGDIGHRTRLEPQAGRRHRCQCGNRQSHGCAARWPRRQRGPARPGTAQSAYCAAKHAIQGFSESLRCELMHDGSRVRVTMVQLPAVNTPQFDWSVARLPRAPQPIPPIYQPAVAARAVVYAADHPRRREHEAGFSSVGTIIANKLAPGLLDRYLAQPTAVARSASHRDRGDGGCGSGRSVRHRSAGVPAIG